MILKQKFSFTAKNTKNGSVAKNLAPLQNQKKPSQLGKLIIFIRKKIIHKGENYSVKLQKYNFCNGTVKRATNVLNGSEFSPSRIQFIFLELNI